MITNEESCIEPFCCKIKCNLTAIIFQQIPLDIMRSTLRLIDKKPDILLAFNVTEVQIKRTLEEVLLEKRENL